MTARSQPTAAAPQRRRAAASWVAVIAATVVAADALVAGTSLGGSSIDSLFEDWVYNAVFVAAAASCVWRGLRRSDGRAGWLALGAGLACWSAGEIYWTLALADLAAPPSPSASDWLMLSFYPLSYAGIVLLVRERVRDFQPSLWLDGVVGGLAIAAVGAALLFDPVLDATGTDSVAAAVNVAYPLGDLLLLAAAAIALGLTGWRPGRAWLALCGGLSLAALADGVFLYRGATEDVLGASAFDALWTAAGVLLAIAPWQAVGASRPRRLEGWRLLAFPSTFALSAVGLLGWDQLTDLHPVAVALAVATLAGVTLRLALTLYENTRLLAQSVHAARSDALTALGNRRRLMEDLDEELAAASDASPRAVIVFDLDGFKLYNDSFGHPEGDLLLARLARKLRTAVAPYGEAYRVGGDEFCTIVRADGIDVHTLAEVAAESLSERGEGFEITSSYGVVLVPAEGDNAVHVLKLADQRLYGQKDERPSAAGRQARDVLLRALEERDPDLRVHVREVADLAVGAGKRLGLSGGELTVLARAAELHDIGKMAVPDTILNKPGPLDDDERAFMRRHAIVGEQILAAAPAMSEVALVVRASHERLDGGGYPDGLSGDQIPLGARIVAVCDAYDALTSERPYRAPVSATDALAELRRCAGTQFDPAVVEAFVAVLAERSAARPPAREALLLAGAVGRHAAAG